MTKPLTLQEISSLFNLAAIAKTASFQLNSALHTGHLKDVLEKGKETPVMREKKQNQKNKACHHYTWYTNNTASPDLFLISQLASFY